jgi:hypothetical protein
MALGLTIWRSYAGGKLAVFAMRKPRRPVSSGQRRVEQSWE